ncbi:MAG: hypothetical protein HYX74_05415 [Acidobacteria bacterium]|nr:hypothetical protein [Acidobacteriota bacterium]
MEERDFFIATGEPKPLKASCPYCRQVDEYPVRWQTRVKKKAPPPGASPEDKMRFQKARSHMVRVDDKITCKNPRCRRTFDIPSHQSVVLL